MANMINDALRLQLSWYIHNLLKTHILWKWKISLISDQIFDLSNQWSNLWSRINFYLDKVKKSDTGTQNQEPIGTKIKALSNFLPVLSSPFVYLQSVSPAVNGRPCRWEVNDRLPPPFFSPRPNLLLSPRRLPSWVTSIDQRSTLRGLTAQWLGSSVKLCKKNVASSFCCCDTLVVRSFQF